MSSEPKPQARTDLYVWERKALWALVAGCFGLKVAESMVMFAAAGRP